MNINKLDESETGNIESEISSDSTGDNRKCWITAQEVAGIDGMPTTDRRCRDLLDLWCANKNGVKRKRKGTKAFEYHISILPPETVIALTTNDKNQTGSPLQYKDLYIPAVKIPPYGTSEHSIDLLDEFALIPGYRVQVSAGHGAIAPEDEIPCRHLAFRRKWLKYRGFSEKDLVIVWCKGESMEPAIYNNDTLVVHIGKNKPVDGGIYVLRNHDQLWVKRIQSLPNAWLLLSDNPRYPPIEVPKDEQHNFQIVGKVVHIAHDLD
jgi:phage repressor protein C with HTH and peptisase S24 domain